MYQQTAWRVEIHSLSPSQVTDEQKGLVVESIAEKLAVDKLWISLLTIAKGTPSKPDIAMVP